MSREYAMSRVRDALEKSDGNHLKAQRLLASWLEKDHSLLLGLVAPHLQAIVTHAINHAAQPQKHKTLEVDPGETGEFGAAFLDSLKGGRSEEAFGFGDSASMVSTPA